MVNDFCQLPILVISFMVRASKTKTGWSRASLFCFRKQTFVKIKIGHFRTYELQVNPHLMKDLTPCVTVLLFPRIRPFRAVVDVHVATCQ